MSHLFMGRLPLSSALYQASKFNHQKKMVLQVKRLAGKSVENILEHTQSKCLQSRSDKIKDMAKGVE